MVARGTNGLHWGSFIHDLIRTWNPHRGHSRWKNWWDEDKINTLRTIWKAGSYTGNERDGMGRTALWYVVDMKNADCARKVASLICDNTEDANPDTVDDEGVSPMQKAEEKAALDPEWEVLASEFRRISNRDGNGLRKWLKIWGRILVRSRVPSSSTRSSLGKVLPGSMQCLDGQGKMVN